MRILLKPFVKHNSTARGRESTAGGRAKVRRVAGTWRHSIITLLLLAAGTAVLLASSRDQLLAQSRPRPTGVRASADYESRSQRTTTMAGMKPLTAARQKLAAAQGEDEQRAAEQELRQAVEKYFDQDMKQREQQLDKVKQRVVDLEEQAQKRAAAKKDILELQLQLFKFEAEGLGLFGSSSTIAGPRPFTGSGLTESWASRNYTTPQAVKTTVGNRLSKRAVPQDVHNRLHKLRKQLREADDSADRRSLEDELMKAMSDYFDADMQRRQAELADIKKRVDEMRDHFARRREAKGEIVDLQVRMFVRESQGLGFFGKSFEGRLTSPGGAAPLGYPSTGSSVQQRRAVR